MPERKTGRRKIPFAGPLEFDGRKSIAYLRLHVLDAGFALDPSMKEALKRVLALLIEHGRDHPAYIQALREWGEQYHVDGQEFRRFITQQILVHSHRLSLDLGALQLVLSHDIGTLPPVELPPLPDLSWNPFEESREAWLRRCYQYADAVEIAFRVAGLQPVPDLRSPEHIWWLAGYQFCGWSGNAIANALEIDQGGVSRAINRLAQAVGLRPRRTEDQSRTEDQNETVEIIRKRLSSIS